jgi:hypothetical protein
MGTTWGSIAARMGRDLGTGRRRKWISQLLDFKRLRNRQSKISHSWTGHIRTCWHYKNRRRQNLLFGLIAAIHRTRIHNAHIVSAIHVRHFLGGRLLVMVLRNRAHSVSAATRTRRRPQDSGHRGMQQQCRQQTPATRHPSPQFMQFIQGTLSGNPYNT